MSFSVDAGLLPHLPSRMLLAAALALEPLEGPGSVTDDYPAEPYDQVVSVTAEAIAAATRTGWG